tara:strand:- start:622 stop:858 length:237 start_codon:yes stop_codon:yes gene_type:complete
MNSWELIIKNSIKEIPIGETENCIWFICDIGIVALFKINKNLPELKILKEALGISLDLSKEEKKNYLIEGKKGILFYS